jgi:putative tricarboxylic transport membrane protein
MLRGPEATPQSAKTSGHRRGGQANADRVSGSVLFLFALAVIWQASKFPFGTISAPDSGFLPLSFAITLALLSALVVLRTWLPQTAATEMPSWGGAIRVVVAVAALAVYASVVDWLGYLISTLLVMLLLLRGIERTGWGMSLLITCISVVISYVMFRQLGVALPQGVLPF